MKELNTQELTTALRTWFQPGEVFEVRVLEALTKRWNTREHTEAGYFDIEHLDELNAALCTLLSYKGVYVSLNPLNPAVLGRAKYVFKSDKLIGAKDEEVLCRRWLPIDCDAKRVSGVSSSDEEHTKALEKAQEIREGMCSLGWPAPIVLDSGNGAQLLYRINLPAADDGLVKRVLEALLPCSDEAVDIDQTVFNPARIWRLPGAWNCKGDECPEQTRIHRQSRILELPEQLECVSREQLEALAVEPAQTTTDTIGDAGSFNIHNFVARHFPEAKAQAYNGGTKWVLDVCPFNADHNDRSAVITRGTDGKIGFKCHHNGCVGKNWHDLRALLEPKYEPVESPVQFDITRLSARAKTPVCEGVACETKKPPLISSLATLNSFYPERKPVIIDGILRECETANIIAAPKTGKTWLVIQLAISIAMGKEWMGRKCTRKKVLVIDNELHPTELVYRYNQVAAALGVTSEELEDSLFLYSQRGDLKSITSLSENIEDIRNLGVEVVIVDAFYRALPRGTDENSNSDIMALYNSIDIYAKSVNGAFILVHHTSKGSQVNKSVTDIGAGAGSQSRAADAHIALLKHLEKDAVVVKGVTRSFPAFEPFCIRQSFPLWAHDPSLDPRLLEGISDKEQAAILKEAGVIEEVPKVTTPEDRMTENSIPDLLRKIGGDCTKTKFREFVSEEFCLSQRKAKAAIDAAVQSEKILAVQRLNHLNKIVVHYRLENLEISNVQECSEGDSLTEA